MMSWLIIGAISLSSCCANRPVVAPPPLPERPVLNSITQDRNDRSGELGVWMDFQDLRKLTKYAESVEAVKDTWKK
jgi:hypothetical protein